ncbi:MAG: segregation and condensation protein A [Desulfococcaceae bacterium]
MIPSRYEVRVENVFEGPMDLLVYLIKKHEVDIYDIPIAMITDQYLGYLEWMKAMNIDYAGDFLLMAATLAQIKSRMLLPVHQDEEDAEDPRMEIARPLLEYLRMKEAADRLGERPMLGDDLFLRRPDPSELTVERSDEVIQVSLFELIDAFQRILDRVAGDAGMEFTPERFTIRDKIAEIVELLEARNSVTFTELFTESGGKEELIVTFLALLEMAKIGLIRVAQQVQSGIIRIFYQ